MKKKIFFILSSIILLVVFSFIFIGHFNHSKLLSNKKENDYKVKELIKSDSDKKEDDTNDNENNENSTKNIDVHNYSNDYSNSKSNKPNMESNSTSKSNVINNNTNTEPPKSDVTPQNTPTNNNPIPSPEPPREQTAWEKLGISEYAYYHTEMYGARIDLYGTDISFCNSEAKRILNSYDDVSNTRSYSCTGKYTYTYIGCSVDVTFYDGRVVGYNEAKRILGF